MSREAITRTKRKWQTKQAKQSCRRVDTCYALPEKSSLFPLVLLENLLQAVEQFLRRGPVLIRAGWICRCARHWRSIGRIGGRPGGWRPFGFWCRRKSRIIIKPDLDRILTEPFVDRGGHFRGQPFVCNQISQ